MVLFTMKFAKVMTENISITMYLVLQSNTLKYIYVDFWLLREGWRYQIG